MLWPYAVQAVVERHNRLSLDEYGRSPLERFTGSSNDDLPTNFHTWGCPVFILEAANQSGAIGTPKWEPRARTGVYLGHSPCHAGSVALVLSLRTGFVSPQFHLVFDDEFTTVSYLDSTSPPPNWSKLTAHSTEQVTTTQELLSAQWLYPQPNHKGAASPIIGSTLPSPSLPRESAITSTATTPATQSPHNPNVDIPPSSMLPRESSTSPTTTRSPSVRSVTFRDPPTVPTSPSPTSTSTVSESTGGRDTINDSFVDIDTMGLRRSPRLAAINAHERVYTMLTNATQFITDSAKSTSSIISPLLDSLAHCFQARLVAYYDFLDQNFDGSRNSTNPLAQIYLASQTDNEVYTLKQMMLQPDREQFVKAMETEVNSMFEESIWEMVPRSSMLEHYRQEQSKGKDVKCKQIMMIWSFKRKRHPDGTLNKYKARLCCHGGQQQWGVNYWDTYAPVVSWSSIRILMTLAKLHKLHTKSVDFVQAYPQAKVNSTIYLHTPPGVQLSNKNDDMVLRLKRNLYGLKDAGRTWYQHLTDGLDSLGFIPTESDPCIFLRETDVVVLYVDDCIIISKTKAQADKVYNDLHNKGFRMTDEGTMEQYLGLLITDNKDGSFRISQPHLIDRIIASVPGMTDAKSAKSPAAVGTTLTKDEEGKPRKDEWEYRSVIGMLNYLVNCSHPELAFSVHQCARFCANPKHSHEQAVKRILRYLLFTKRTKQQGIVFRPDTQRSIDTYVDASFAGEWNSTWSDEPSSVMSRTGYVIMFARCPIIWCSKLQTEIALSTTESEYIALSQSLRDVIPLIELLRELRAAIPRNENSPTMHCTVHEDNQGCIDLVKTPRMRPRTKHIALKYHHFRSFVRNGSISVEYVDTGSQIADIFTKALGDVQFAKLRNMLMGW